MRGFEKFSSVYTEMFSTESITFSLQMHLCSHDNGENVHENILLGNTIQTRNIRKHNEQNPSVNSGNVIYWAWSTRKLGVDSENHSGH